MNPSWRLLGLGLLVCVAATACGKKGPPLPPLRPLPAAPADVTARRVVDRVHLRLVVPSTNQDPQTSLSLSRIHIYARSLGYGSVPPVITQLVHPDYLVGSIDVRPAPAAEGNQASSPAGAAEPVDPRPAPGDVVSWSETLPGALARPLDLTRAQRTAAATRRVVPLLLPPTAVAVPFSPILLPTRYYVAVGVSAQGRTGRPSPMLAVRLGAEPPAPEAPVLSYDATTLTLSWTTTIIDGAAVVYPSNSAGVEGPAPVQAARIRTGTWSTPVTFGQELCFTIRQVLVTGPVSTEGPPVGPVCETPVDRFPPSAPVDPLGVAEPGRVVLQWSAVDAADLAGYRILRADGPGATLQPLNADLEQTTGFADRTTKAGVEYTYVIVAVDKAGNVSEHSSPVRVTGQ